MKGSTVLRWRTVVVALGWLPFAWAPAVRASVPSTHPMPPPRDGRTAVFGIIAPDSAGKPYFLRTDSVPYVVGQAYGWFIGVGESRVPVEWTETLTLPAPAAAWGREGATPTPDVSISSDGRTAVVRGEAVPEFGVISHFWTVARGDPAGRYTIVVKIHDGREERFSFVLLAAGSKEGRPEKPVRRDRGSGDAATP